MHGSREIDPVTEVPEIALGCVIPYLAELINGFGDWVLNRHRKPPEPGYDFNVRARSAAIG
jgi:hypothetical protein